MLQAAASALLLMRAMLTSLLVCAGIVAAIFLALCALLYFGQESFISERPF